MGTYGYMAYNDNPLPYNTYVKKTWGVKQIRLEISFYGDA